MLVLYLHVRIDFKTGSLILLDKIRHWILRNIEITKNGRK